MLESIVNMVMLLLFVVFMVFIFGGYHKNKSSQREKDRIQKEKELH